VILIILQFACQIRRMNNEEIVLTDVFPQYSAYKKRTARIIPGLY